MAKEQKRSNREIRKPKSTLPKKAATEGSTVVAAFAKGGKTPPKARK